MWRFVRGHDKAYMEVAPSTFPKPPNPPKEKQTNQAKARVFFIGSTSRQCCFGPQIKQGTNEQDVKPQNCSIG